MKNRKISNIGKVGASIFMGVVGLYSTLNALGGLSHDVKVVREIANPTIYNAKVKRFGRAQKVTVNPVTHTVKKYVGNKSAVNKKPIKLY